MLQVIWLVRQTSVVHSINDTPLVPVTVLLCYRWDTLVTCVQHSTLPKLTEF